MSEATVKTYVSRILTKLDCDNRVQAALLARDAGLQPAGGSSAGRALTGRAVTSVRPDVPGSGPTSTPIRGPSR